MRKLKLFIIFFPVILVSLQVAANIFSFISPSAYAASGFYLNTFLGTNVLFAGFLVAFTFWFRFCDVSRACAIAEVLFAVNYLLVKEDNLYNIWFQIIVGTVMLAVTVKMYTYKFPFCNWSLLFKFFKNIIREKSCEKGLDRWHDELKNDIRRRNYERL